MITQRRVVGIDTRDEEEKLYRIGFGKWNRWELRENQIQDFSQIV